MAGKRDTLWRYAPLWSVLFAATATLAKGVGQHYILKRKWQIKGSDVATALVGAVVGYVSFRAKHGDATESDAWYKR